MRDDGRGKITRREDRPSKKKPHRRRQHDVFACRAMRQSKQNAGCHQSGPVPPTPREPALDKPAKEQFLPDPGQNGDYQQVHAPAGAEQGLQDVFRITHEPAPGPDRKTPCEKQEPEQGHRSHDPHPQLAPPNFKPLAYRQPEEQSEDYRERSQTPLHHQGEGE